MRGLAVSVLVLLSGAVFARQSRPAIFAPGVISTALPEFSITFAPDGREAYFNRAAADRSSFPIYRSTLRNGAWTPPELVPFASDGRQPDPFVTPDGRRLYFSSQRPRLPGAAATDLNLWFVERDGPRWGAPQDVGAPVNGPSNEVFASVTRDGTLYFGSDRDGRNAIYRAVPEGAGYRAPERLPDVINGTDGASNPLISPDERLLFFVSERGGGLGGSDIYVSRRTHGEWAAPTNLGAPVNSPFNDFAPALSPDGRTLFFTSERPGLLTAPPGARPPGDIYSVPLPAGLR
jgi:Tol biopolymer transport system component